MSINKPQWLDDIEEASKNMPFGAITFNVKRHRNMTTKVEQVTHSSIKYDENHRAFDDIGQLMNNLIASGFDGTLQFEQTYRDGKIVAITIKNKKTTNYRDKK